MFRACTSHQLGGKMIWGKAQNHEKIRLKLVGWSWNVRNRCNSWVVHVLRVWGQSRNFKGSYELQIVIFRNFDAVLPIFWDIGGRVKNPNSDAWYSKIGARVNFLLLNLPWPQVEVYSVKIWSKKSKFEPSNQSFSSLRKCTQNVTEP